jgi:hypothetical protein
VSRLAAIALAEGLIPSADACWVAMRLRQGRFSPWALEQLDRRRSALEVRMLRARRLGYRGTFEDFGLVEKWFEEQGLNPF